MSQRRHPPPRPAPPADEAALGRAVRALLADKKGIDEGKAKVLRRQWEARAGKNGNGRAAGEAAESENPAEKPAAAGAENPAQNGGANGEDLSALFEQLRERTHAQIERRDRQFAEVEKNLRELKEQLAKGDVRKLQQLERELRADLKKIPGLSEQRRKKITGELEEMQPELREMAEWRKRGTMEAREKAIGEMRDIHKSGAKLQDIARRIREAREKWRQWDLAEGGNHKLYAQFDRACSDAYQLCREHFKKQRKKRGENTRRREEICAELEKQFDATDWRNPDWKALRTLVNARRIDWRKTGAPANKSRQALQRRFDEVMEKFEAPLERERRRNYKMREKLTAEAEALAAREDEAAAFAEFRRIKRDWVLSVPSERKLERALWKRYCAAGDRIFEKRKLGRKDLKNALRENLDARKALCAEMEASCKGDARAAIRGKLNAWQARWEQLNEAHSPPKSDAEKIRSRYKSALENARRAMAQSEQAAQQAVQEELRKKSEICAQLEALALGESDAGKEEKLHEEWGSLKKSQHELPKESEAAVAARYELAAAALQNEDAQKSLRKSLDENLARLHGLLLQLEIHCELESPPEFAKQRMALQIERLSLAMGKTGKSNGKQNVRGNAGDCAKTPDQLIREILTGGAVSDAARADAMKRLEACRVALRGREKTQ
ncbi:MAG: hypothetical protein IBGAMO2_660013 [Arenicellales bacterium IbO2]|nr:MAG: hypothetical protein IBGAMO2_660013 [Arenicellales bacterium IbO2]